MPPPSAAAASSATTLPPASTPERWHCTSTVGRTEGRRDRARDAGHADPRPRRRLGAADHHRGHVRAGLPARAGVPADGAGRACSGINHTLDTDAIAAGLRTKALDAILFPPDPVGQAPHIFAIWRQTMPIVAGHTIVGPMLRISWGGAANLCSLELAMLIELDPARMQLVILGSPAPERPHRHGRPGGPAGPTSSAGSRSIRCHS